jgi:hypothetical protein
MKYLLPFLVLGILLIAACGGSRSDVELQDASPATTSFYHGGPVMTNPVNVYVIWYGDWKGNEDTSEVVNYFINHFDSTSYFGIDREYYEELNGEKIQVTNKVQVVENYYVGIPLGMELSSNQGVPDVVANTITQYGLTPDPDGLYLILTDQAVKVDTICEGVCGWHNHTIVQGVDVVFSVVGNTDRCPKICSGQAWSGPDGGLIPSPNNNWAADGMANVITHEISESLSDPHLNAWFQSGAEIGDLCAWNFGTVYVTSNGGYANIKVGDKDYLIQQMWTLDPDVDAGGQCGMQP